MITYESTAWIDAAPEAVWAVMTDGARYGEWDSGIELEAGELVEGTKIKIASETSPGKTFTVKVTELDAPRTMVWVGAIPFGLFKGVRSFSVQPEADGARFTTREDFVGPLLPLMRRMLPDLQASFDKLAANLKAEVESQQT